MKTLEQIWGYPVYPVEKCPICGKASGGIEKRERISYILCHRCLVMYQTRRPSDEDIADWYSGGKFDAYTKGLRIARNPDVYASEESLAWVDQMRASLVMDVINDLELRPERCLDFGCGRGFLMDKMPWQTEGVDIGPKNGRTIYSNINDAKGPYDLITAIHSLEHVPHPVDTLKQLRSLLAPKGAMLVQVPWATFVPLHGIGQPHLCAFTAEGLNIALNLAGMNVPWIVATGTQPGLTNVTALACA